MFLVIVLLVIIAWLLWTLHQDMLEANQRQRNMKMELIRLIDRIEQLLEQGRGRAASPEAPAVKVGLNTASKSALRTLPKVGAVVAERIISARPFNSIDALRDVEGVSNSLYQSIADRVTLD